MPKVTSSNVAPLVDQFVEVDEQYQELKRKRDLLRAQILETGLDRLTGGKGVVDVSERKSMRLDRGKLEQRFGAPAVAQCTSESVSMYVTVKRRV